jgi:hypothetical protein
LSTVFCLEIWKRKRYTFLKKYLNIRLKNRSTLKSNQTRMQVPWWLWYEIIKVLLADENINQEMFVDIYEINSLFVSLTNKLLLKVMDGQCTSIVLFRVMFLDQTNKLCQSGKESWLTFTRLSCMCLTRFTNLKKIFSSLYLRIYCHKNLNVGRIGLLIVPYEHNFSQEIWVGHVTEYPILNISLHYKV